VSALPVHINRRAFLKQITSHATCISIAPGLFLSDIFKKAKADLLFLLPGWLEVLSKGPQYYPPESIITIPESVSNSEIKNAAHQALREAFSNYRLLVEGRLIQSDPIMDFIVLRYKTGQYLIGQIAPDFEYPSGDFMENITFDEDPALGLSMIDMSEIILNSIAGWVRNPEFHGFNRLQMMLLNASFEYALNAVGISEKVFDKTFDHHKATALNALSKAYNNYGLVLNYLGRTNEATAAYGVALQFSPDDLDIKHNIVNAAKIAGYIQIR
jgi:tetratricopeptide (TPR) repeat protein